MRALPILVLSLWVPLADAGQGGAAGEPPALAGAAVVGPRSGLQGSGGCCAGVSAAQSGREPRPRSARREPARASAPKGSGSGLLVDGRGHVLTNHHVVERCQRLRVQANGDAAPARVLARDREVDLALLASELPAAENGAEFRSSDRVRLGEPVIVAGFPLHDILSTDLHVFPGIVSALAGPGDDARLLQISAPVQPGNSGGPLLDDSGQVIGVVLGQLSTGVVGRNRIPQNVNFAIRGTLARSFLERQGVRFHSPRSDPRLSTVEIAARARAFTVLVECLQ